MWLVGMMGSGKTSAGRIAARNLGVGFADTDEEVAQASGATIADIWRSQGEQAFRRLERESIATLAVFEGIVATGGGAVLDEANRAVMASGTVVWLRASPEVLAMRAAEVGRPLLRDSDPLETMTALLGTRETLYRGLSDHEIDTERLSSDEIAARIEDLWNG